MYKYKRDVAQFGSAYALGACGRRFESCHPDSVGTLLYCKNQVFLNFKKYLIKRKKVFFSVNLLINFIKVDQKIYREKYFLSPSFASLLR